MQTSNALEQEHHPSGWSMFSRLFVLAAAMMALSYGLIMSTLTVHTWLTQ